MTFSYVTIVETFETAGDVAARGTVTFTPVAQMHNGISVVAAPEVAALDSTGSIAKRIAATTDPATRPVGVTYRVDERIVGQPMLTYYKAVPHDQGATLQLSSLPSAADGAAAGGFALRSAVDYDDSVAPSDGQVMTWDGTTGKYHPEAGGGGGGAVSSVNGLTGAVTITASGVGAQPIDSDLTAFAALAPADGSLLGRQSGAWAARSAGQVKTDLSLDQVNNTADTAKPVSGATAAALAGKADTAHTHTVGNLVTTGSPSTSTFLRGDGTWAPVGGSPVAFVSSSGAITPNATAGSLFRYDASADVVLTDPTGGTNGQLLEVQVYAAGADRLLTVGGSTAVIPAGGYWWGRYSYDAARTTWILDDSGGGAADVYTITAKTAAFTLAAAEAGMGKAVHANSSSAVVGTIPTNASVPIPVGTPAEFTQFGTGQLSLAAAAGVTLLTPSSLAARVRYSTIRALKTATDTWLVGGDLA